MAAGIRVNQLAKELGVESKALLVKLREEGLGEVAPNHMSVLKLGLAESVRQWFSGGGGTAVETAAPVDTAVKTKPATRKRKTAQAEVMPPVEELPVEPEPTEEPEKPKRRPPSRMAPEAPADESAPPAPAVEEPAVSKPQPLPSPVEQPVLPSMPATPIAPPSAPAIPATVAPASPPMPAPMIPAAAEAPTPMAPSAPPQAPSAPPAGSRAGAPPQQRPTITLSNRQGPGGAATIERKPVTPAPRMVKPAAAVIQGPKIVREEAPEVIPVPRPRRGPGLGPAEPPAFTPSRPQGGRGVKTADDDEDSETGKKKAGAKSGRTLSNRRRGPDGRRGEAEEKLREFTEADLIERRDRLAAAASYRTGFDSHLRKSESRGTHALAKTAVQKGEPIELEEPITIKSLSGSLGIKSGEILRKLLVQGVSNVNINSALDNETAARLALEYGLELHVKQQPTLEQELVSEFDSREPDDAELQPRSAIVTILGHVDHGKTSLLDRIRKTNVAAGEAGGITQHIAAWMVTLGEGKTKKTVTFIDTPGHQAFTSMRARGATMTDVVVLVVSAAEGVQPQTIESINHARAAGVPIVVAMNKIDRPDTNPDMVLGQLAKENLNPVEWGGDIEVVRTSATTGQGIEDLIEILDYQSQLLDLKANPSAPARGTVVEAKMDEGLGVTATVLVQDGTLHVGDVVLIGPSHGRVRSLVNDKGLFVAEAGPSMPVIVAGLNEMPSAGDNLYAVEDMERARAISGERAALNRQQALAVQNRVTAGNLLDTIRAGDVKTIHLIIKGDAQGSVETLVKTVGGQNTSEVQVKVIHSGVGGINESDVELAMATRINPEDPANPREVAIIGFHVVPDESARALAEQNHVEIKTYRVIYEIFDDLKKALSGMLEPEVREKLHGHAEIRQVFKVSRVGNIAGCMVTDGHIQRGSKIRLIRDSRVITEDLSIETLRRLKDDVREVKSGFECGIKLANYDDIKIGDRLEAYVRETHQRTL